MDADRAQIRAWLKEVLERTGETPTGLARKAGLAQSTLTRFLGSDDAPLLSLRSVSKIAQAASTQPPGFVLEKEDNSGFRDLEQEALPLSSDHHDDPDRIRTIVELIKGSRSSADAWILQSSMLKLAGYMPGDILIVDLGAQPQPGMVACAQVYQWAKGTVETIFRIYEPPYLVAATDDPAGRRPLLVDNNHVVIKGAVTENLRVLI